MPRSSQWAYAAALGLGLAASPALAVDLTLSQDQVGQTVQQGIDQAKDPSHGFQVKDYVLFGVKDPLRIEQGGKLVDAVIVATPREELLYQSYLDAFEGKPLDSAGAAKIVARLQGKVGFRVFAHSSSLKQSEKDFLQGFGNARLVAGGKDYEPVSSDIFGPGEDFFILSSGRHALRWLGSVTFVFDAAKLPVTSGPMKLAFDDGEGNSYNFDLDLADYR